MHKEKLPLYENRIKEFLIRIQKQIVVETTPLEAEYRITKEPVPFSERKKGKLKKISEGNKWGDAWDCGWFHITGTVPKDWKGKNVVAKLNFSGEGCIFDESGCPIFGLTSNNVFKAGNVKDIYRLFVPCKGGEKVDLWVETGANGLFGVGGKPQAYQATLNDLKLGTFNEDVYHLNLDINILDDLMHKLPKSSVRKARILRALNDVINLYAGNSANVLKCRKHLKPFLASPAYASDLTAVAVGHAHIDTGWLWPVRESIRKCGRTFASQLDMMDKYPDYVFGASQAQHYQFVKDHYPELYKKVKQRVKEGRWEVQGGTWVENDMNIVSGESLVRQFLQGKNFYMDEFGLDIKNLWLPDVFGYSSALPQILKKSGVDYFLTQKISWNQFNEFPHNTFMWRGIDGTEVLTHFPPENGYNSTLNPSGMIFAQGNLKEKDVIDEYMVLFGVGNGGGGPREDHIERGLRMKDLEGVPKVKFGKASDFFDNVQKNQDKLDVWDGELYLELHRGTYTTQSRTKRFNRKLENRLAEVEFLYSNLPAKKYPRKELQRIWRNMLMNQFHDIIPGSSITRVYTEAEEQYAANIADCKKLVELGAKDLFAKDKDSVTLFNTLSWDYTRPITLPEDCEIRKIKDQDGVEVPVQYGKDGASLMLTVPAQSFVTLTKTAKLPGRHEPSARAGATNEKKLDGLTLENELVKYQFNKNGELIKGIDKETERPVIAEGKRGNLLSLYLDKPNNWDAWDVDIFYSEQLLENAKGTKTEGTKGPLSQTLKFELTIGNSKIKQTVTLAVNSKRIDFHTEVEWNERHRMLRVAFPTTISSSEVTCDIQYGYLKRDTHHNTSWDMAKFEICAHKYVDMSNPDYGVALLNDCKYGHKVLDNVLDLNLLRAPMHPDPKADEGHHEFTYSLLPHTGDLVNSDVMSEADMLNRQPMVFDGANAEKVSLPCEVESDNVSLEVLKRAEKDNSHVIRLVEKFGETGTAEIRLTSKKAQLIETDLMEWNEIAKFPGRPEAGPARAGAGDTVEVTLKPFEIKTFKIK